MPEQIRVTHEFDTAGLKRVEKALKEFKDTGDVKRIVGLLEKKVRTQKQSIQKQKEEFGIVGKLLKRQKDLRTLQKTTQNPAALRRYNTELKKIGTQLAKNKNTTQGWGKALGSFQFKFNALGNIAANVASAITRTLNRAMREAVATVREFESAMAGVKAISGATGAEFKKLRQDAIRLGGATIFTARQVAELQLNYSKLGFSTQEILNATEATLSLAAATDEGLAESALVAGSTLRAFNLDAVETQRVVDVMAKSFTSSALNLEHWRESMKFSAAIAQSLGLDIETTAAAMAKLSDTGIKGSIAGTSMKNIMLRMGDASSALSRKVGFAVTNSEEFIAALKALNTETFDLTEALALTDRRAAPALLKLVEMDDAVAEMANTMDRAFGASMDMATIRMDTLKGSLTILKSAWEGFIISLESGSGILTEDLRKLVDKLTDTVNVLKILTLGYEDFIDTISSEQSKEAMELITKGLSGTTFEEREPQILGLIDNFREKLAEARVEAEKVRNALLAEGEKSGLGKGILAGIAKGTGLGGLLDVIPDKASKTVIALRDAETAVSTYEKSIESLLVMLKREEDDEKTRLQLLSDEQLAEEKRVLKLQYDTAVKANEALRLVRQTNARQTIDDVGIQKATVEAIELEHNERKIAMTIEYYESLLEYQSYYEQEFTRQLILYEKARLQAMQPGLITGRGGDVATSQTPGLARSFRTEPTTGEQKKIPWVATYFGYESLEEWQDDLDKMEQFGAEALSFAITNFAKINDAEERLAQRRVERHDQRISEMQRELQAEITLQEQGYANRADALQREIAKEKELREQALKEQEKIEKRKRIIEALAQGVNLATAVSSIWKWATSTAGPLGIPIAIASTTLMLGTWVAQLAQISKSIPRYAEGGEVGGKRHSEGGTLIEAERGEYIINRASAQKFPELLDAINNNDLVYLNRNFGGIIVNNQKSEELLEKLVQLTEETPKDFGAYIEWYHKGTKYRLKKV